MDTVLVSEYCAAIKKKTNKTNNIKKPKEKNQTKTKKPQTGM